MNAGVFGSKLYRCTECASNPKLKDVWGCEKKTKLKQPTFKDMINGVLYQYWNCPVKFIPNSVYEFLRIKNFYSRYPGASMPDFENISPRFLLMDEIYTNELNSKEVVDATTNRSSGA